MEYLKKYVTNPVVLYIVIGIFILSNIGTITYFLLSKDECPSIPSQEPIVYENQDEEKEEVSKIKVDIKGYVKKPGVYELIEGAIIDDLIKLAGGVKSGGTTDNINLSKKLNNEDMVYIFSKTELKKLRSNSTTEVITSAGKIENSTSSLQGSTTIDSSVIKNTKVNLNTATKEELMSLSGIGEAKALNIMEYRSKTPFTAITEIMNISGIGESVYEKIKDYITV